MKKISIKELTLENFKGVSSFAMATEGQQVVSVFGANATGKTTLADSIFWLLFNKDSQWNSKFEIKTLDSAGKQKSGINHTVQAVFIVDGQDVELKKSYYEKWAKKRGSVKKEFTGHKTDHFVDGVPVKKKEYTETVGRIADEDTFKLLTSPSYFPDKIHWQQRREILLAICGDITDEQVMSSDQELSGLFKILGSRKIDDHKKVVASRRAEINKELEKIPVRIDELTLSLSDVVDMDSESDGKAAAGLKTEISEAEKRYSTIENGGAIAELRKELAGVETELIQIENKHTTGINTIVTGKNTDLDSQKEQHQITIRQSVYLLKQLDGINDQITKDKKGKDGLTAAWYEENKREFTFETDSVCSTCGQDIPQSQIEEVKEKALALFNVTKAETLAGINKRGKALTAEIEAVDKDVADIEVQIKDNDKLDADQQESINSMQSEISNLKEETCKNTTEYKEAAAKKKGIEASIEKDQAGNDKGELLKVGAEIDRLKSQLDEINTRLFTVEKCENTKVRIGELKQQERKLAKEFEKLEHELYLMDQFTRVKVDMLEDSINSRFKLARFKLFQEQVNGGLQECCEVLFDGVPFSGGLNNGARVNVGLDIINTLSDHYGLRVPIFVDNSESVSSLLPVNSQLIKLIVSPMDKNLRTETENKTMEEEA
jgi:DNA repair exonuclease SbcCD ATPase subunit